MPSAAVLRRAWRHPIRTYAKGGWTPRPLLGQRPFLGPIAVVPESAFRPGVTFDLLDRYGNRLGWGRVGSDGTIELFDAESNRLGGLRPTFRAFAGNGMSPRKIIEAIVAERPDWGADEVKAEVLRRIKTPTTEGAVR